MKYPQLQPRYRYKIHDKLYDLADFVKLHPGGIDMFNNLKPDTNITPMIYAYHKNPKNILAMLPKYEVSYRTDDIIIKYDMNYTYDKYFELKKLVYDEIHEKKIPLYWSNTEIAYNAFMLSLYLGIWTYCFFNANNLSYWWMVLLAVMNTGVCNLIFHEASHYTGFINKKYCNYLTLCLYPIMTERSWKHTHNYKHHCFTNSEYDVDFTIPLMRHCDKQDFYFYNRFQSLYSLFLFGISSFERVIFNGIRWNQYNYICLFLLMYYVGIYKVTCWVLMCGFLFAFIAQLSHIQDECIQINTENKNDFLYNQVSSSMNYKTDNPIIRFICFSLDIQIEHHLFPNIPHSSLRQIQHIVRDYCDKNDIPYIEKPSIFSAFYSYICYLYKMGNP
jgi:linoleoyl-CoA desaturase